MFRTPVHHAPEVLWSTNELHWVTRVHVPGCLDKCGMCGATLGLVACGAASLPYSFTGVAELLATKRENRKERGSRRLDPHYFPSTFLLVSLFTLSFRSNVF